MRNFEIKEGVSLGDYILYSESCLEYLRTRSRWQRFLDWLDEMRWQIEFRLRDFRMGK